MTQSRKPMSVYSMTGYATAQQTLAGDPSSATATAPAPARLGLEIRSVNSRFLDLAFRLPDELRAHEPALRELITASLKRGKVEVRAALESGGSDSVGQPSADLLQQLLAVQAGIRAQMPQARELSVADVLRIAGGSAPRAVPSAEMVTDLMRRALKELLEARRREGSRLLQMLQGHVAQLRALAQQALPLVPQLVAQQRARFVQRFAEALALASPAAGAGADASAAQASVSAEAAQDRALTEATAFAIRIDVAEEITRLDAHLQEIARLLDKGGEVGKRLDFLIQELHREANTLGSKSAALELTRISVDMKVLIEQMREQVQNIE
jgi:uncharacterized protein (TIGR00255 family)